MLFIYKKIVQVLFLLIVLIISSKTSSIAQSMEEEEEEWVPSMLQSRTSTHLQLMQYGGYGIGWKYRGFDNPSVLVINGVIWDSKSLGFPLYTAMTGINTLSRTEYIQSFPFVMQFANINASEHTKQITVSSRFQSISGRQFNQLVWSNGLRKKSWATMLKIQEEKTFVQDPALGKRTLLGMVFSAEKMLTANDRFGMAFWYNDIQQTKQSPSVLEAIQLSGNKSYNPGWGWDNGQLLFPNTRQSNLPIGQIMYTRKMSTRHHLQISWAMALGKQSEDGLDWTSAKDPRPDYYKYLPSYYSDSLLQNKMKQLFQDNPSALQLDFDQMKKINQSNKEGKSFYIISRAHDAISLFQQAIKYRYNWSDRLQILFSYNASFSAIKKSNTILNLLGGKYYMNYNSWVNDEGVDVFQHNLTKPDQHIEEAGIWGPQFAIKNVDHRFGLLGTAQFARWEYRLGLGFGIRFFQREGYNQNGLYPESSFGKSIWYKFPSNFIQWETVYKRNARLYYSINAFAQTLAPTWKEAFLNISMQDRLSKFLLPAEQSGLDIGIHYQGIYFKTDWHSYTYWQKNKMDNTSFYHDYYNAFVIGAYGYLHQIHHGIDLGLESNFNSIINYQIAFSWNGAKIINNPIYAIELLNDAYPLESDNLHLKNLPSSTNPSFIAAAGLIAQLSNSFRIRLTAQMGWERYIALDFYRRSFLWEKKYKEQYPTEESLPLTKISNGLIGNFFCNKNFQFNSMRFRHRISLNLQVNNIFNTIIPVFAFEQTRFDYKNFKADKFAPKYLMGRPLSGAIQLIYQIN